VTDPPIIDPAALARLDKLGGHGFALRIIGIFLGEGPRRIADARDALDRRDGPALAHAVHALISSAGNVGATGLTALVRDMERDAELERWDVLPDRSRGNRCGRCWGRGFVWGKRRLAQVGTSQ
jgi:HPt (histidine-containing phosphotransfer) domain-containing protein